ncbi:hypothetical protein [Cecembia lonarensis]|uniref:Seryl-tRNA synthetase n=1 Tax=Cecembia lonarensis (strain CCUG 58316 / KCTC 22772 / LW9) TaxID=1225176 RepID=K1LZD1_CECL9|nr:hypothetical protein [Cecembia lonarensis]EKB49469.1 hypothetical protein B879_01866 [Cecembia lonarensis LW9]
MKKLFYLLSMLFLFLAVSPMAMAKKDNPELTEEEKSRLVEIEMRVDEIKAMDFSTMEKAEKKAVRSELKEIKKEAKDLGGGVYLSVGAIIIILLILILLT